MSTYFDKTLRIAVYALVARVSIDVGYFLYAVYAMLVGKSVG
jgi:hypothetical protein